LWNVVFISDVWLKIKYILLNKMEQMLPTEKNTAILNSDNKNTLYVNFYQHYITLLVSPYYYVYAAV